MKNRFFALILAVMTVLFVFGGCSEETENGPVLEPNVSLITDKVTEWAIQTEKGTSVYFYSITDLDKNGRPEVIAAENYGIENITEADYYEVSEDGTSLIKLTHVFEGESQADLMQKEAECYKDSATDTIYYVFIDVNRESHRKTYNTKVVVSLKDGKITEERLATEAVIYVGESEVPELTYTDALGNEITADDYMNAASDRFAGCEKLSASFVWKGYSYSNHDKTVSSDNTGLYDILFESYNGFGMY